MVSANCRIPSRRRACPGSGQPRSCPFRPPSRSFDQIRNSSPAPAAQPSGSPPRPASAIREPPPGPTESIRQEPRTSNNQPRRSSYAQANPFHFNNFTYPSRAVPARFSSGPIFLLSDPLSLTAYCVPAKSRYVRRWRKKIGPARRGSDWGDRHWRETGYPSGSGRFLQS